MRFLRICFPAVLWPRLDVNRIATYLYLDANGIFGQALEVGASIVLVFILFGKVALRRRRRGVPEGFSLSLMGRFRGGQAKMAIVSSSLFGTISGSAVANVVVDGTMTIPMMKKRATRRPLPPRWKRRLPPADRSCRRSWAPRHFSSPNICRFLTPKSRSERLVPAVLFYIALFVQVDLLAGKQGLRGAAS